MLKSIIFDGTKFYISKMHSNMVIFAHPEIATGKKKLAPDSGPVLCHNNACDLDVWLLSTVYLNLGLKLLHIYF